MDDFIRSFDVPIVRNIPREKEWSYNTYTNQILEALEFHCAGSSVSDYMKHQISKIMHQGYVVINEIPFSSPVRSIYESMEKIVSEDYCRGVLNNITEHVGFSVLHFS